MRVISLAVTLVAGLSALGCVRDHLVECGDGRLCPTGTVCDVAQQTCVDLRGLGVPEGDLDFASVGCGSSAQLVLPVRNFGVSPIDFDARSTVSGVTVTPATGTVAPGGSLDLVVDANPDPNSVPGVTSQGSLVLATGFELISRTVKLTTVGALVTADQRLDFGQIAIAGMEQRMFTVRNSGNVATDLTLGTLGANFSSSVNAAVRLEAGATQTLNLTYASGVVETVSFDAPLSFTGSHCQPPPSSVRLTAETSGDPVLTSLNVIDFGTTTCSVGSQLLTVTMTSQTAAPQTLTSTLSGPAAAGFVGPGVQTLAAGPSTVASLDVSRSALGLVPVGAKTATMTVDIQPVDTQKVITLTYNVVAPLLQLAAPSVNFGNVPSFAIGTRMVQLHNVGNDVATVSVDNASMTFPGGTQLSISPSSFQIQPGGSKQVTITLAAGGQSVVLDGASFQFSAPGACSPVQSVVIYGAIAPE